MNKVIYLKSIIKNYKPKTKGFDKEIIKELKALGVDLTKPKVKPIKKNEVLAGRDFILSHTEEFLQYAVDYSLDEKIGDIINPKKLEEKIWQLHAYRVNFFYPHRLKINIGVGGCLQIYDCNKCCTSKYYYLYLPTILVSLRD